MPLPPALDVFFKRRAQKTERFVRLPDLVDCQVHHFRFDNNLDRRKLLVRKATRFRNHTHGVGIYELLLSSIRLVGLEAPGPNSRPKTKGETPHFNKVCRARG